MADAVEPADGDLLRATAAIVAAYLAGNAAEREQLGPLIRDTLAALRACLAPPPAEQQPQPAVPIHRSVRPEHVVCLECGTREKALKRHLRVAHGLTPEEYRARWGLPRDHPLVAPDYAARRSALAKASGLGRRGPPPPTPKRRGKRRGGRGETG